MSTDAGSPLVVGRDATSYRFFGDEHGQLLFSPPDGFARGDVVELVPPHCDPTVDRYDVLWLVRGDVVVGVTDVIARGRRSNSQGGEAEWERWTTKGGGSSHPRWSDSLSWSLTTTIAATRRGEPRRWRWTRRQS